VNDPENIFEFPCRFPIKVMGRHQADFETHVLDLISPHAGDIAAEDIVVRSSSKGKYLAVTVTIQASSREQLDDVYRALTDSVRVLYAI
jgi:putative lipoic acid-binding regulatory protein